MHKILDKGYVELVDFMGGDLRVVNAARVSFNKESLGIDARDEKLIHYLMKNRHGSPFEHSVFTFRVKAPIFVVREWQRHRIGSYSEMSGRYVEFTPEFYIPEHFRIPADTNKQGSVLPSPDFDIDTGASEAYLEAVNTGYSYYRELLDMGVAKEMARMVMPLSLYTEFLWTVNARSLMNFLNLRTGEHAQWEIREYALAVQKIFLGKMPITHHAWLENDRLAP